MILCFYIGTFRPENTQSIASALHIRDVKLIPREALNFDLTQREAEIYKFYAQFCSTKPLKKDKPRPYIPMASKLVVLPDVRRIVLTESVETTETSGFPMDEMLKETTSEQVVGAGTHVRRSNRIRRPTRHSETDFVK